MSTVGDTLLLSVLQAAAAQSLPTATQLAALNNFAASCHEAKVASILSALVGRITGWEHPTQGQGIAIGRPTEAPTYQVLFTRAP